MPMIDIDAAAGTVADVHHLAQDAASTVMRVEKVPAIPMFRKNTAASRPFHLAKAPPPSRRASSRAT